MKKIFFFAALWCGITSCQKDLSFEIPVNNGNGSIGGNTGGGSANATYYIKGKVDGVAFNYTSGVSAVYTKSGNDIVGLFLTAYADVAAGQASANMSLVIGAGNTVIKKGDYSEFDKNNLITGGWARNTLDTYTSDESKDIPFVLTIASMDEHVVTGTFKGDVFYIDDNGIVDDTKKKTISEGEFKVKYKD